MANATNVLANGIEITGSIKFSNDMVIDGKVDGEITSIKARSPLVKMPTLKVT
jgi:cytoskeletal protein CcmA (bactofilin family)